MVAVGRPGDLASLLSPTFRAAAAMESSGAEDQMLHTSTPHNTLRHPFEWSPCSTDISLFRDTPDYQWAGESPHLPAEVLGRKSPPLSTNGAVADALQVDALSLTLSSLLQGAAIPMTADEFEASTSDDDQSSVASLREAAAKIDTVVREASLPPVAETHSVAPASLACRKRLTLTATRSTHTITSIIRALRSTVAREDWAAALQVTQYFCCSPIELPKVEDHHSLPDALGNLTVPESTVSPSLMWSLVRVKATTLMTYDDFAMFCASLFDRLEVKKPGNPPVIYPQQRACGHPEIVVSIGARSVRQLICDLQTLLLMCMATKLDLQPCEQLRLKNLVASALYSLVWHPNTLEALSPIFFSISAQSANDCFCSFLIHWGGTGVLQLIFEVFILVLAKRARWRAILWLLSCTELGEGFLLPSVRLRAVIGNEPFLPEVGNILSCRAEILARLRFPVNAITDIMLDLSTYQLPGDFHDQPWPFEHSPRDLVLSLLPLVLCKPFSDEIMVHRGWHDRTRATCPVSEYSPAEMLKYFRWQIAHPTAERRLLSEDDFAMDHVLDEVVPAFVFLADPELRQAYLSLLPLPPNGKWLMDRRATNELSIWRPTSPSVLAPPDILSLYPAHSCDEKSEKTRSNSDSYGSEESTSPADLHREATNFAAPAFLQGTYLLKDAMLDLWRKLTQHPAALDRCLCFIEIAGRITETFFVQNRRNSPFTEVIEINSRESLLQMSKRTVGELTGCTLGRVDLCYLRLLESYETIYGVPSQLSGLVGPRKRFQPCLNMSLYLHRVTLLPLLEGPLRAPAPSAAPSVGESENAFVYPTLLPTHVANLLPAWLSAKTHGDPYEDGKSVVSGWRVLAREIMVAASRQLSPFPAKPRVAPHLDCILLNIFLPLYVEAANPRALHLLTRLAIAAKREKFKFEMPKYLSAILERAKKSRFLLIAEAVSQITLYENPYNLMVARLVMEVYLSAGDTVRAIRHLEHVSQTSVGAEALAPYKASLTSSGANAQTSVVRHTSNEEEKSDAHKTKTPSHSKEAKLRASLATVKGLAASGDVRGAIRFFYDLRESSAGILDISVANKIMHLCVTNGFLAEAWDVLTVLRRDAHSEINGMDFIPGSCVRPDVVTCNIAIKGLAKQKPPRFDEIERLITQMEEPFHLGGDGVKADQVTFNTAINAALQVGDFERAWVFFRMMRSKKIKIDGYTCSILVRQLGTTTPPSVIDEISSLVGDLELYEESTLFASLVDLYSTLGDEVKLKRLLDRHQAKNSSPSPNAVATAIRGYTRCRRFQKAIALWRKLEGRNDVRWTSYIMSSGLEAFAACGKVCEAMQLIDRADSLRIPLNEQHVSSLISLCVCRQQYKEAFDLYAYLERHGLRPCWATCSLLINSCVQLGDAETGLKILEDSYRAAHPPGKLALPLSTTGPKPVAQPDVVIYSSLMKALCDRGSMEAAEKLFRSLPERGMKADIITYNTMLEGFARQNDLEKVKLYFDELLAEKVEPSCYTLTILLKFYARRRAIDHVLELFRELPRKFHFQLDHFAYTAVIAACSWNGRVQDALHFTREMRGIMKVSQRSYSTLLTCSVRHQDWQALGETLAMANEDNVVWEHKEMSILRDLFQRFHNASLPQEWYVSGFNQSSAQMLRALILAQSKTHGTSCGNGNRPGYMMHEPCLRVEEFLPHGDTDTQTPTHIQW